MNNIVLNIPHTSINGLFDKEIGKWPNHYDFIKNHVNKWTDWYVTLLFANMMNKENVQSVVFPFSRFVCDVERLKDDPLEKEGQGIIYDHIGNFQRGELNAEQKNRIMQMWENHQKALASELDKDSILVDCHSFPSELSHYNICIGYNDDWSYNSELIDGIIDIFKSSGYSVGINEPFSNSITPQADFHYKSVMIEVNKKLYMNEKTMSLENNQLKWMKWDGTIRKLYNFLSNF